VKDLSSADSFSCRVYTIENLAQQLVIIVLDNVRWDLVIPEGTTKGISEVELRLGKIVAVRPKPWKKHSGFERLGNREPPWRSPLPSGMHETAAPEVEAEIESIVAFARVGA
jgi:hypothetical protein